MIFMHFSVMARELGKLGSPHPGRGRERFMFKARSRIDSTTFVEVRRRQDFSNFQVTESDGNTANKTDIKPAK